MIDEDLGRKTVALLGTVAPMLIEDAQDQLVTRQPDASEAAALGATLSRLWDNLSAMVGAARVLTRGDA